jgi:hypothetical protein
MTTQPHTYCDYLWETHTCDLPHNHPGTTHQCGTHEPGGPHSHHDTATPPEQTLHINKHHQDDGNQTNPQNPPGQLTKSTDPDQVNPTP